ncbi:MAG: 50S ribosomal protein L17 [Armatimonadetes bacterium]|mgnify:CR=1 FL=1|jgi:large subunit ribosomal protein L17|nr:50S ribosomal protein L17 [Armatimonadota bacterium]
MRHRVAGRKLGLPSDQRMALLKNLVQAVIEYESIETTAGRGRETQRMVEKVITTAREDTIHNRRMARRLLGGNERGETLVHKLFTEVAPRYANRSGGYTRLVKLGPRRGDGAERVKLELIETA